MSFSKKILAALLLAIVLASGLFAADPVAFVDVINYGIMSDDSNYTMTVEAKDKQAISYSVVSRIGGVIFQEVAVPASSVQGSPVSIEYRANQPDGQRLTVSIGDTVVTADLYDWQLIPAARFAATKYTACMPLLGRSRTPAESEEDERYGNAIMWAAFFRMVKEQYPQAWENFTAQINGITPEPKIETPRLWLRR